MPIRNRSAAILLCLLLPFFISTAVQGAVRHAFVTSTAGSGNLTQWPGDLDGGFTGLAAADKICQNSASLSSLPEIAAASASFRAWISDINNDAFCHVLGFQGFKSGNCLGNYTSQNIGPWVRTDGTPWAADLVVLATNVIVYSPLKYDENGALVISNTFNWTGTEADGSHLNDTCADWGPGGVDGVYGLSPIATANLWTYWSQQACSNTLRLVCLEALAGDPVTLPDDPGALVFVTSAQGVGDLSDLSTWGDLSGNSAGRAGADKVCENSAISGHLPSPSSFVAWLSTQSGSAAARLTTDGPFRRVDGFRLASDKASLLDGALDDTIQVDELRRYITARHIWTATKIDGTFNSLPKTDCADWSSASISKSVNLGANFLLSNSWTADVNSGFCGDVWSLYCFSNVVTVFWNGFETTDPAWTVGPP